MRRPIIAGNWKLFKTIKEAASLINELKNLIAVSDVDIVVAPVFTALSTVSNAVAGTDIKVAAQDCFWEEEGAYTGEVSPKLLKDAGCSFVIIGHSERRQYFAETDETVNKKIRSTISAGLTAIVCVGETLCEREANQTFSVIERQIRGAFAGISATDMVSAVVAYEPVWAIGTGKSATDEQAQEVHAHIRTLLMKNFSSKVAETTRIIYGGSVKPDNIKLLMTKPDIDGALVGGASLKADLFSAIVNYKR